MKKARRLGGVRVAMFVAACLAISAGFGLHPEPASAGSGQSLAFHGATLAETGPGAHDCLACRSHRPLLPAPTPADVTGAPASTALLASPRPLAIRVFPLLRRDGRSPPATS